MVQSYSPVCANMPHVGLMHVSFGPPESITQTASRSVQPFLHSSPQSAPILKHSSLQGVVGQPEHVLFHNNCCFAWESGIPSIAWFLGSTRLSIPNGISIGSAVLCRCRDCDRPADHATWSVTIGRLYLRSTVMRPNENMSSVLVFAASAVK